MNVSTNPFPLKTWTKGAFLISTDASLVPIQTLNEWFALDEVYWTNPLPLDILQQSVRSSLCFGLYYTPPDQQDKPSSLEFVGIARCVTDYTTFVYITDVYVHSSHQGKGLGTWLIQCVGEVLDDMPYLRRSMLLTMDWHRTVPFYEKLLKMNVVQTKGEEGIAIMSKIGKGHPQYTED